MSIYERFGQDNDSSRKDTGSAKTMTFISSPPDQSPLLNLPPELRCQIYEYIVGSRVVYVRINWTGIFSPTGYSYSCLKDLQPLLDSFTRDLRSESQPFNTDVTVLTRVCRQMYQDTALLPFKLWIWAFEDIFTLDQFVTAKGLGCIPVCHKNAIRSVAVAPPGHHQSHERVLQNLQEVLLIGSATPSVIDSQAGGAPAISRRSLVRLRRDTMTDAWVLSD